MYWQNADDLSHALETCFTQIQRQRMADVPIVNTALRVQAVDFQLFKHAWLGVLISPWFMNILYFNDDDLLAGEKITHQFPAGAFEFTVGYEEALGFYQSCSLYSPMFAFTEQETAVQTAQAALQALLYVPERPVISRRDLLRGRLSQREMP